MKVTKTKSGKFSFAGMTEQEYNLIRNTLLSLNRGCDLLDNNEVSYDEVGMALRVRDEKERETLRDVCKSLS